MSEQTTATTTGTGTQGAEASTTAPSPADLAARQAAAQQAATQAPAPQTGTFSQEYVTEIREEAKANRLRAEAAEAEALANATERDQFRTEATTLRATQALNAAITEAGGNSVAAFTIKGAGVLEGIDIADQTKVNEAVAEFITQHPELKASQVGASRVDHAGGTGEDAVTQDRFNAMNYTERAALYQSDPATYQRLAGS